MLLERARAEHPHRVLVLDQKHRAGAGQVARQRGLVGADARGAGFGHAVMARQVDRESGALSRLALDEDETAGLGDDAIDGRKPQPGARADLLGGEKRLEDAFQIFLRDARCRYRDTSICDVMAGRHGLVAAADRRLVDDIGGADGQGAAIRHGVARVDGEIDDDLLELALIDLDEAEVAAMHDLELDVLADEAAQQMRQIRERVGDVEDARLQGLLAREGQQLAHQIGGAVGVLLDLHDVGEGRVARPEAQQQKIAKADHRGEQIVEIMRHAAGELADRLHLLRLGELRLDLLLLGGVDEMQDEAALAVAAHRQRGGFPVPKAQLDRPRGQRAVGRLGELGRDLGALGIGQEAHQRLADERRGLGAEECAERRIRLRKAPIAVNQRDADRSVSEEPLEALLRPAQRFLPIALGREVAHHRAGAQGFAAHGSRFG